jgi:hypothetical protein
MKPMFAYIALEFESNFIILYLRQNILENALPRC